MKAKYGIWEISTGKGDRMYINCDKDGSVMHPSELCGVNGLGVYGYENITNLAVAILKFEKMIQKSNSILSKVENLE